MNRNHLFGFIAAAVVLGALAFAGWHFLEIYPDTKQVPPSRGARINEYLALDRWLEGMGYRTRTERWGDLSLVAGAEEKQIFMQASLFHWDEAAVEYLVRWIEEGGNLFLVLDNFQGDDYWAGEEYVKLLREFGIEIMEDADYAVYDSDSPYYDDDVSFEVPENNETLILKDRNGTIKIARIKRGEGKLTVSGLPYFLQSRRIGHAPNARLASALFAPSPEDMARDGGNGILFIRGTARARGLLGELFRQGNFAVLVVSLALLLVTGFWAAIPRFGLVRGEEAKPGKPLRERFLAEGHFLKRHDALNFYRDVYVREIRRRLFRKEGLSTAEEIYKRVAEYWEKTKGQKDSRTLYKIFHDASFSYREFPKIIFILKTLLECI